MQSVTTTGFYICLAHRKRSREPGATLPPDTAFSVRESTERETFSRNAATRRREKSACWLITVIVIFCCNLTCGTLFLSSNLIYMFRWFCAFQVGLCNEGFTGQGGVSYEIPAGASARLTLKNWDNGGKTWPPGLSGMRCPTARSPNLSPIRQRPQLLGVSKR